MTHDEIVEKAARAICAGRKIDPNDQINVHGEQAWTWFVADARAAIAALWPIAMEDAAKEALATKIERRTVPCPDGIGGCLVHHFREDFLPRTPFEIACAIRAKAKEFDQ